MTGCRAILALTCILLRASTALAQGDTTSPVEPPLPTVSAVIGHPDTYTLSPDFVITDVPTTREYWWNISAVAAAPDGYPRQIYAVNNLFPGPMIEANEGDEIIVHIDNYLHIGMTIHWHGMFQNGSQWMDGVAGVSQCPIPPGGSFTYQFKVEGQYGSYWWHSHFANTLADGIMGGLVIHSTRDPLKRGEHFDQEMVVMVSDWMDVQSETIVHAMHTPQGYRGSPAPPQGNAILINGWGRTNCSNEDIPDRNRPCVLPPPPEIKLPAGKRVKLRILNNGAFAMMRISIDQHPFDVVEVDDTPIYGPEGIHEVQVSAGQRTSIIINTDQGKAGDAFFLRSNVVTACIGRGGIVQTGLAVIRYVDAEGKSPSTVIPDTKAWDNLQGTATKCQDLDEEYTLVPREAHDAPKDVLQTHVLSSSLGVFTDINGHSLGNFGFNGVPFQAQIGYPLLAQLEDGLELNNSFVAHVVFDNYGAGDIIVNNLDTGISHPYHLHGRPFFIVSRGKGNLTAEQWEANGQPNLANSLRRDTIEIPGGHHAVLRWYTDLPGVWPLHCHIGWHLAEGKLAAIVVQPNKIKSFGRPDPWSGMCSAWGKGDIGPAKRDDADGRSQFEEDLGLPASKRLALEADGGALPRRSRR